jgi:hypothetical protein
MKHVFTWNITTRWQALLLQKLQNNSTCMIVYNLKVCYYAIDNPSVDVVIKSNCIETIPRVNEEVPLDFHGKNHLFIIQIFYIVNFHNMSFLYILIGEFLVTHNCKKIHSPLLHERINLSYVCLKFCKYASQDNWTPNILIIYLLDNFFVLHAMV